MNHLQEELENRGFLHQFTDDKVFEEFGKWGKKFYFWVDCSADSLTIWNFVALQMAIHFMLQWNKCFLLVWWATSTIWNPSGKDAERPILTEKDLDKNQAWITKQFDLLVKNVEEVSGKVLDYEIVNNYDFFKDMNVLDFLKEVWRVITVNWMMNKDIVKKRVADPKQSISYAEFSYMLIMGYDYYYLNKNHWVTLEVGWSDEWDGILSGMEIISKKSPEEKVYGVTNKLIMDASGKKFGKSEWNAIWLDKTKSSPYLMYQYFISAADEDVEKYLKLFTHITLDDIKDIAIHHFESPEKREGQKKLAYEVVRIIHWKQEADIAVKITEFMFWKKDKLETLKKLSEEELLSFQNAMWGFEYVEENFFETIVKSGLAKSNGEARNSVKSWAIYINEEKITDFNFNVSSSFINDKVLFIKKGKKNQRIVLKK